MLFSRTGAEMQSVEIPDKQPVFVFEGRQVDARVFDPTEGGMDGISFGRAAKKLLQEGLAAAFRSCGHDTVAARGIVAQKIPKRRFRSDEEADSGNAGSNNELSVFEIEQRLRSVSG